MLSFAFWALIVLIVFSTIATPFNAHQRVEVTRGLASWSVVLTALVVWLSIELFQHHTHPTTLVWVAVVYMVGSSMVDLVRVLLKTGRSIHYSNAYMAWVVIDAALSLTALFILRG